MSAVIFPPWVGRHYEAEGFRGLRLLLMSESHYGPAHTQRPTVTPETIKALAQHMRHPHPEIKKRLPKHPHYAKILASVHGARSSSQFSTKQRRDFWERVCYYNFFQEVMPESRYDLPEGVWTAADVAFERVLGVLQPDLVIVFSKRVGSHLKTRMPTLPSTWVRHPSSGFSYAKCNPTIATALDAALLRKREISTATEPLIGTDFLHWRTISEKALPAHGGKLPAHLKAELYVAWAQQMVDARVAAALALSRLSGSWRAKACGARYAARFIPARTSRRTSP